MSISPDIMSLPDLTNSRLLIRMLWAEWNIVLLEPELVMSTPTYDPFGTETTYKSKLFLCEVGHKQKWT